MEENSKEQNESFPGEKNHYLITGKPEEGHTKPRAVQ